LAAAGHYCEYIDAPPSEIKGMFPGASSPGLGLTAHRGWARLLTGRMSNQVKRPEYPGAHGPARGWAKAPLQDDGAMDAHHYHPSSFNAGFARA
jgi:hypothetical protein